LFILPNLTNAEIKIISGGQQMLKNVTEMWEGIWILRPGWDDDKSQVMQK